MSAGTHKRLLFIPVALGILCVSTIAIAAILSGASTTNSSVQATITQLVLNTPTVSVGDLMLASVAVNGGNSAIITVPSGWTQIARSDSDTGVSLVTYWKIAGASEPSNYTWTINGQTTAEGGITDYSGVDTSNPIDTVASNTGLGTQATTSAITTNSANEEVVAVFATDVGKNSYAGNYFAVPTGMTQRYNVTNIPFGPSIAAFDMKQAIAGTVNGESSTINGSKTRDWAAQQIAFRPVITSNITFDNAGNATFLATPSGLFDFTTSGTNRMLVVSITNPSSNVPMLVTYNGRALTMAVSGITRSIWYLINPDIGTHSIAVTFPGNEFFSVMATSLDGVDQTTGIGSTVASSSTISTGTLVSSGSVGITTQRNGSWIVDVLGLDNHGSDNNPVATGASQVLRNKTFINAVSEYWNGAQSTASTTAAGTYNVGYSWGGNFGYGMLAVEVLSAN